MARHGSVEQIERTPNWHKERYENMTMKHLNEPRRLFQKHLCGWLVMNSDDEAVGRRPKVNDRLGGVLVPVLVVEAQLRLLATHVHPRPHHLLETREESGY